jgi:hypothetical protein
MPPAVAGPREAEPASGIILSENTPASRISTFALGEQVELSFRATGMKPGQDDLKLDLHFVDEMDRTVKKQSLEVKADAKGEWVKEIAAPCETEARNRHARSVGLIDDSQFDLFGEDQPCCLSRHSDIFCPSSRQRNAFM